MSETNGNPLLSVHQQAQAETVMYEQVEIVSTFGEPQAEYAAIRKAAALMDLPQRGFLELTGKDRLSFLNNLLTNQTFDKEAKVGMAAGSAVYAFLLNAKTGRIIADMFVLELGERTLLEMDRRRIEVVRAQLDQYVFSEQVKIVDRSGELHEMVIHGPTGPMKFEPMTVGQETLFDTAVTVWRDDPCGVAGHHIIVPIESARKVWMNLLAEKMARPIGWAAFNAVRIEAGRPLFGIDFDDTMLPAETGQLSRAVSFTKGCYPGQEIVARMHARQQVSKQIVGIRFPDDAMPIGGNFIYDEQSNQIGGITSSTISPVLSNIAIALGLVKKPFFAVGTVVNVPAEGAMRRAVVSELPFVRSS